MSTKTIDISNKNISGKCDLKCAYNFNYQDSNLTATNNGIMLSLTYDNNKIPPVTYNNEKYTVQGIAIVSPSLHTFNGNKADAEIMIEHVPVKGGPMLIVSVPIKSSSESSDASYLLTEIISTASTNCPNEGEKTNLSISGFTLNKIIPTKPYYSYTDNANDDWIIFGILDAIPLNSNTLDTLQKIIKPWPGQMTGGNLFINKSGPNSTKVGDGIYISCKPTGSSEEEIGVEYSKNSASYDLSNILNDPITKLIFQIIIGCILFIIVFSLFSFIYKWIISDEPKIPKL